MTVEDWYLIFFSQVNCLVTATALNRTERSRMGRSLRTWVWPWSICHPAGLHVFRKFVCNRTTVKRKSCSFSGCTVIQAKSWALGEGMNQWLCSAQCGGVCGKDCPLFVLGGLPCCGVVRWSQFLFTVVPLVGSCLLCYHHGSFLVCRASVKSCTILFASQLTLLLANTVKYNTPM